MNYICLKGKWILDYLNYKKNNSGGSQERNSNGTTFGVKENMYWLPVKDLNQYKAFPGFMKDYLSRGHVGIEHIATDKRKNK